MARLTRNEVADASQIVKDGSLCFQTPGIQLGSFQEGDIGGITILSIPVNNPFRVIQTRPILFSGKDSST